MILGRDLAEELTLRIASVGTLAGKTDSTHLVAPLKHFFDSRGYLLVDEIGVKDGKWTRKEILARYLLLRTVVDQGPDIKGIRMLLVEVLNKLYSHDIAILHEPLDFFRNIDTVVKVVKSSHESIKKARAEEWAKAEGSTPNRYSLIYGQSMRGLVSTRQVLEFCISRWGTPLAVPLILEQRGQSLVEFVERHESAELMSRDLKSNEEVGLGQVIGDKACHVFAKAYVHTYKMSYSITDAGWSPYSFELPLDSNAGRVLFGTGWLQCWADLSSYEKWDVIRKRAGKGGTDYIRVTNIRNQSIPKDKLGRSLLHKYDTVVRHHLKTRTRWSRVRIQEIPNAILLGTEYGIGDFDDGLLEIGLKYCKNHSNPDCGACPLSDICVGHTSRPDWIVGYRT